MSRRVRTHQFSTGRYRIDTESQFDGWCEQPDNPNDPPEFVLWISPSLRGLARLDTLIHEALHAEFPHLNEQQVRDGATNIAKLLWRLKYRGER